MVGRAAQVMTQAGGDVKEEVWKSFIVLLTNTPELHAYAARALFRALRQHAETAQTSLLATSSWYTGAAVHCVPGSCLKLQQGEAAQCVCKQCYLYPNGRQVKAEGSAPYTTLMAQLRAVAKVTSDDTLTSGR